MDGSLSQGLASLSSSSDSSMSIDSPSEDISKDWLPSPVNIEGYLTLSEGLGFMGRNDLRVMYMQCGMVVKEADIDWQQGRFAIEIDDPSSGLLLAHLRDERGFLVGVI